MREKPFEFNGIAVRTPEVFKPSAATTSTDSSDRTQDLVMHNTPIGTIESYNFEWKNIPTKEAAVIYRQIRNRKKYKLRYMSADTGNWETDYFYTSNYDFGTIKKVNGKDAWESFSFNAIMINPV